MNEQDKRLLKEMAIEYIFENVDLSDEESVEKFDKLIQSLDLKNI